MKDAWYKRNPRDFYEGTRKLTLEQRGAYSDIIDLLYMHGGAIPDDAKWMSHALHVSTRKWASIRTALLAAGKIETADGSIVNKRVTFEVEARAVQSRTNAESALNRERTKREKREKLNENNETAPQKQHHLRKKKEEVEREEEKQRQPTEVEAARDSAAAKTDDCSGDQAKGEPQRIDYAALMVKLAAAAGPIMRLNCAGIHDTSPIVGCLRAGADLGLDVLPTIERLARTKPAGSVSSWAFFVDAIAKAKAARLSAETTIAKKPPKKLSFSEMAAKNEAWWAEQKRLIEEDEARHAIQH